VLLHGSMFLRALTSIRVLSTEYQHPGPLIRGRTYKLDHYRIAYKHGKID
jgi:hypothetical protein